MVKMSARPWQGCDRSDRPLMTGTSLWRANPSLVSCAVTRSTPAAALRLTTPAASETDLRRREIDTVAAELSGSHVERESRAQTRLLEDERDRARPQVLPGPAVAFHSDGPIEERHQLPGLEVGDGEEVTDARCDRRHES